MSKTIHYREPKNQSLADIQQFAAMESLFLNNDDPLASKLDAFTKYASRQSIAKFLTKYELFKKVLGVNGSIIEGGVLNRPGFPRHSPGSLRNAFQTLPVTADC